VLRRTFAPKGVSRHEPRRHEETADNRDKRATRVRSLGGGVASTRSEGVGEQRTDLLGTALAPPAKLLEYQIRVRAYQLYEARGRKDSHELEDWFRAKEELTIKQFRTATA
jgi:hypothetical protein